MQLPDLWPAPERTLHFSSVPPSCFCWHVFLWVPRLYLSTLCCLWGSVFSSSALFQPGYTVKKNTSFNQQNVASQMGSLVVSCCKDPLQWPNHILGFVSLNPARFNVTHLLRGSNLGFIFRKCDFLESCPVVLHFIESDRFWTPTSSSISSPPGIILFSFANSRKGPD